MIEKLLSNYILFLEKTGLSPQFVHLVESVTVLLAIVLLAFLSDRITRMILVRVIGVLVKRSKNKYDDILLKRKVFSRLAHIAPALVINATVIFLIDAPELAGFIKIITKIYIIVISALITDSLISALHEIYHQLPVSRGRNIKGYVQLTKIMTYIVAALVIISVLTKQPISGLLTGLGAFAAVLMLVFKDTILGLVASIQLAGNKMVSLGDWISMPKYNADGDVIDIGLNTVKVQNWDKTIATIPTYALVTDSFSNWKGMEESGGRRIKRSINIDMQSVCFVDNEDLHRYKKIRILKDYIEQKEKEIEAFNKEIGADTSDRINARRLTNLGTFRKYLELYLKNHPRIHNDMTFLVRHLQPDERGIPIEIYVFSNDQAWANYEAIQADIFDHILAVIPEFGLRVFQNPTGSDWRSLLKDHASGN
ncbi:MAG: mechanosensitive ion channel family protein [Bacteroidales bacterium]|nr:mechanosensitive ion channel family protein [Bacteroidales bacterium]